MILRGPRQTRRRFLRLGRDLAVVQAAIGLGALGACRSRGTRVGPPNIVLVLVDDLGVSDSSSAGSAFYDTPALDRMTREGMRFTDAYSPSPLCSASRASILTGKLPHRVGITGAITCAPPCVEVDEPALAPTAPEWQRVITPSFRTHLPLDERTIAEVLRERGYATAHIGKWHLGGDAYSPSKQGYDTVVGGTYHWSPGSHLAPYGIPGLRGAPDGEVLEDRLVAEAARFMERERHRPFFVALFHYGVHSPIDGPPDLVSKYGGRVDREDAQRNPAYGALVEACDRSLGRLLDAIDSLSLGEDTLVVFTSDNGGLLFESSDGALRAVTSNAPYRGGKAHAYEGGTRVPFVARWSGTIAPGSTASTPVSGCDLMATFLATAAVPVEDRPSGDGVDLSPLLLGTGAIAERPIVVHFPHYIPGPRTAGLAVDAQPFWATPASTYRLGTEKLVRLYGEGPTLGGAPGTDRFELYDLATDPGEVEDLAPSRPDRVAALAALLDAHLTETGAIVPIANPAYLPAFEGLRVARDAEATLADGVLRVVATGPDPQLLSPIVAFDFPIRCLFRLRSASPTTIDLFHATVDAPSFGPTRRQSAAVEAGSEFVEIEFDVPGSTSDVIRRLRIDPGTTSSVIEFDAIRIVRADDPGIEVASFPFDSASDGTFGGSFIAAGGTTVACSARALHVQMDGPAPRVATDRIRLFGPLRIRFRMRSNGLGDGAVGFCSDASLVPPDGNWASVPLVHDDTYRDYVVDLRGPELGPIERLVFALGEAAGFAELAYVRATQLSATGESLVGAWEFGG